MTINTSHTGAATVDREYFWIQIDENAPIGTKVQLINKRDGVAVYGHIYSKDCPWTHWAPLPAFKKSEPLPLHKVAYHLGVGYARSPAGKGALDTETLRRLAAQAPHVMSLNLTAEEVEDYGRRMV